MYFGKYLKVENTTNNNDIGTATSGLSFTIIQ